MTLIEVLIVISIISLLGMTLYAALANGLRVYKRAQEIRLEQDVALFFDKITRDLKNTYSYSKINFEGTLDRLAFPTIVHTLADSQLNLPEGTYVDQMGKGEYYFDYTERALYRHQANYSEAIAEQYGKAQIVVQSLKAVRFHYHYLKDNKEFINDHSEGLPLGVEVELEISNHAEPFVISRYIPIAVGELLS